MFHLLRNLKSLTTSPASAYVQNISGVPSLANVTTQHTIILLIPYYPIVQLLSNPIHLSHVPSLFRLSCWYGIFVNFQQSVLEPPFAPCSAPSPVTPPLVPVPSCSVKQTSLFVSCSGQQVLSPVTNGLRGRRRVVWRGARRTPCFLNRRSILSSRSFVVIVLVVCRIRCVA